MGVDDFIKEYTTIILWISSIIIGLFIFGEGNVLSYDVKKYRFIIIGLIGLNLYISIKLYKTLIIEKEKPPEIRYVEKPKEAEPEPYSRPFDFAIKK